MFLQFSGKCVMAMTFGTLMRPIAKRIARSATSCGGWGREGVRSEARAKQRLAPGGRQGFSILCRLCAEFERLRDYRVFGNCGRLDECLQARPWLLRS